MHKTLFCDHYGSIQVTLNRGIPIEILKKDFDVIENFQRDIYENVFHFTESMEPFSSFSCDYYAVLVCDDERTIDFESMLTVSKDFNKLYRSDLSSVKTLTTLSDATDHQVLVTPKHTLPKVSVPLRVGGESTKSVRDPFPDQSKALTYQDYFNAKDNVNIIDNDVIIPVKHLKMQLNSINYIDYKTRKKSRSKPIELPQSLCCLYPLSYCLWRALCVIPSLMHKVEQYTAAQRFLAGLKESSADNLQLSFTKMCLGQSGVEVEYDESVLEKVQCALVAASALEDQDNEIFEFYGDSVLKYAVNVNLFLDKPYFNEHSLNFFKSQLVNNELLYKVGTARHLRDYLFYEKFEPSNYKAYLTASRCGSSADNDKHNNLKRISDVVESLIGALFTLDHGNLYWLALLHWYGFRLEKFEQFLRAKQFSPPVALELAEDFLPSYLTSDLPALVNRLGYQFKNRLLLVQALCHSSFPRRLNQWTDSNQRLEFIGDAVLEVIITSEILRCNEVFSKKYDQGQMSDIRSVLVCTHTLAVVATRCNLHKHLKVLDLGTIRLIDKFVEQVGTMENDMHPFMKVCLIETYIFFSLQ